MTNNNYIEIYKINKSWEVVRKENGSKKFRRSEKAF